MPKPADGWVVGVDDLLAEVGHDLRAPLNAILGFGELLQEQIAGPLNEQQNECVGHVLTSGRDLLHRIDDAIALIRRAFEARAGDGDEGRLVRTDGDGQSPAAPAVSSPSGSWEEATRPIVRKPFTARTIRRPRRTSW